MTTKRMAVLALAVLLPAVLVGAAVSTAGGSVLTTVLAGLAALSISVIGVAAVVGVRRADRRLARWERRQKKAPTPPKPSAPTAAAPAATTVWHGRLPLPPQQLRFMSETDDSLVATARDLTQILLREGMRGDADVLDVGSGYGRLTVGLMDRAEFTGSYLGFDILRRHVAWCSEVMTAADQRFRFELVDIRNERYNPAGTVAPEQVRFPATNSSIDICTLFSVFTHLYRPTIEHYLHEISRVLRPGGLAVGTWFLFDDDRLPMVVADTSKYPLRFELPDGSR